MLSPDVAALRALRLHTHIEAIERVIEMPASSLIGEGEDLWNTGVTKIIQRAGLSVDSSQAHALAAIFEQAEITLVSNQTGTSSPEMDMTRSYIREVAKELQISPLQVTAEQVERFRQRAITQMFKPNPAQLISSYRDAHYSNLMDELQSRADTSKSFLSPDEFLEKNGPQPHLWISQLLEAMGLPFEIVPPPFEMNQPCLFRLRIRGTDGSMLFSELSTGEQVLVRFAISLMRPNPLMLGLQRPRLLLLDEMDASLHPEMVQRWLGALERGIAGELGIYTILTTHSPTTVALAPEEAIFEMRDRHPVKVSKQEALNRLTFGVPTLSIDYSGRRQIFCESDTDAASYEVIYSAIKAKLSLPRELNFIGTGLRNKDGSEINSGAAVVHKIVNNLTDCQVKSVFGLIDWDGTAVETDKIRVIGKGSYYTLENILLDPLLVGAYLLRLRIQTPLINSDLRGLDSASQIELQQIADAIQSAITIPYDDGSTMDVEYLGGTKLKIRRAYAAYNGHALEDLIGIAFPGLRRWTGNRGVLNREIAKVVVTDYPEFCPITISSTFEALSRVTL